MSQKAVFLTCIIIFILIMIWDLYLYSDGIPGNSITQSVITLTKQYPLIPWAIGFLMGALTFHFYDPTAQVQAKVKSLIQMLKR